MYKILFGIPAMLLPFEITTEDGFIRDYDVDEDADIWCDFELDYYPDQDYYKFEFETMLGWDKEGGCRRWIVSCLNNLENYMKDKGYDITRELDMYTVFTDGVNATTKFKCIEDAYAWLKMMVYGFNGEGLIA